MTLSGNTIKFLGAQTGTATANDLFVNAVDISTLDASGRTKDGIIIDSVKANGDSDSLKLSIPSKVGDDFAIRTTISSSGTKTTTTGAAGSMSSVPVAKLDTEVTDAKAQNLILVGGTAVNRLTAEALGVTYPTYDTAAGTALSISAGKATLKLVENAFGGTNTALIVAGWDAADTRNAANVLKDYSAYSSTLVGKQVVVTSTAGTITLSAPTVAAAPAAPAANATA
jgi:S-layer protein (TIGR01564 family)